MLHTIGHKNIGKSPPNIIKGIAHIGQTGKQDSHTIDHKHRPCHIFPGNKQGTNGFYPEKQKQIQCQLPGDIFEDNSSRVLPHGNPDGHFLLLHRDAQDRHEKHHQIDGNPYEICHIILIGSRNGGLRYLIRSRQFFINRIDIFHVPDKTYGVQALIRYLLQFRKIPVLHSGISCGKRSVQPVCDPLLPPDYLIRIGIPIQIKHLVNLTVILVTGCKRMHPMRLRHPLHIGKKGLFLRIRLIGKLHAQVFSRVKVPQINLKNFALHDNSEY